MKKILFLLILLTPFITLALSKGDVDGNNMVNENDYILIKKYILKDSELIGDMLSRADVNGDLKITSLDYISIKRIISNNLVTSTPIVTSTPLSTPSVMPTCSGEITRTGTKLTVSPVLNEVKEYEWVINGNVTKGSKVYEKDKIITKASVNLIFSDGQKHQIKCSIKDNLVYHFKYDFKKKKDYIKCGAYTIADKVKYDDMLKKAIQEAGYGTRAGVVEAARFLVGALEYRVAYQGPKQSSSLVGKYEKVGLNIGNNKAWGCRVDGYVQGLDCTNFIKWAFYQNGLKVTPYNSKYYKSRDVVDKIQVGDFLYTPCVKNCKNSLKLEHVGIVIGIDDTYIYVAESMVGVSVVRYKKNDMPSSGKFSLVHFREYKKDGNVTNMWMSE